MTPTLSAEQYFPGSAKSIRLSGRVPAVICGKERETKNVSIDRQDFRRVFRKTGKSTLVNILLGEESIPVLIHVIDVHPVSGDPEHVDFHAVDMNTEVHASVSVQFVGISDAVKLLGGTLTVVHDQIEIKCLPKRLVRSVEVNLEKLKTFHDSIFVSDIPFPEGITVLDSSDMLVASVSAPRLSNDETKDVMGEGTAEGEG
jgi:large subunit ribosomal protein L25